MALTKVQTIGIETGISLTGVTTVTTLNASTDTLSVGGTVNFGGNVSIAGTLTYEDVTNIDAVGLITARSGISVTGSNISVESSEDRLLYLKSTDANAYITFEDTDSSSGFANRVGTVSDGIYFSTGGGGERARIDSSGRIGIGMVPHTSSTGYALQIDGGASSFIQIFNDTSGNTVNDGFVIGNDANTAYLVNKENTPLVFRTNNTESLRIDSSGRLLVGTTTEGNSGADDLTVATSGNTGITIRSGTSDYGNIYYSDATSGTGEYAGYVSYQHSTNSLQFATVSTERLRITSDGKIGVNNTSPLSDLQVITAGQTEDGTFRIGGSAASLGLVLDFDQSGATVSKITANPSYTNTSSLLKICVDGDANPNQLVLKGDGKIGIGTNNPLDELHVNSSSANVNFRLTRDVDTGARISGSDGASPAFIIETIASGTASERMRIDSSGNFGIGTASPGTRLDVRTSSGEAFIKSSNGTVSNFFGVDSSNRGSLGTVSNHALLFNTNDQERMRIDSSGDIGIGENSPDSALHVTRTSADSIIRIENTGNGNHSGIFFVRESSSGTSKGAANIHVESNTGGTGTALIFGCGSNTSATGGERMRIDSSGRLLVGSSSSRANGYGDNAYLQLEGTSYPKAAISTILNSGNANGPSLNFAKSRGSNGGSTIVQSGDNLGVINFAGADGTDVKSAGARIRAQVDGTPGSNDMPGRITFETTPDGSVSPIERMRITSEGKIGIGHDSPQFGLTLQQTNNDSGKIGWEDSGSSKRASITCNTSTDALEFRTGTGDAERANISSKGSFVIRASTGTGSGHSSLANANDVGFYNDGASLGQVLIMGNTYGGGKGYVGFYYNTTSNVIGSINAQGSGGSSTSGVNFNTSSDYRLKENIVDMTDGITRVKQLLPRRFNFITDETNTLLDGFIAHEAQAVVPQAVSGEHNEVDENGDPVMQGMDYGKLTPLLTAALQEAIAEIETLKARLDAAGL